MTINWHSQTIMHANWQCRDYSTWCGTHTIKNMQFVDDLLTQSEPIHYNFPDLPMLMILDILRSFQVKHHFAIVGIRQMMHFHHLSTWLYHIYNHFQTYHEWATKALWASIAYRNCNKSEFLRVFKLASTFSMWKQWKLGIRCVILWSIDSNQAGTLLSYNYAALCRVDWSMASKWSTVKTMR